MMMQAAVRTHYGPPEAIRIQQVNIPGPGEQEVLVQVIATTVSRSDVGVLTGKPYAIRLFTGLRKPRRIITGTDFAGVVTMVGTGVTQYRVGDRVFGFHDVGLSTHAEFVLLSTRQPFSHIPDGVGFDEAVASIEGAHYAINFMQKLHLQPGQRVLVIGATGAIGSAAVQLLVQQGVEVTAVGRQPYLDQVKSWGAVKVTDYQQQPLTDAGTGFDAVFDTVGKSNFNTCKPLLAPKGVYLSSELGPGAENLYLPLLTAFSGKKVRFPVPLNIRRSLEVMRSMLAAGTFRPLIDRHYPLDEIAEAFRHAASGQKAGNLIIDITERSMWPVV